MQNKLIHQISLLSDWEKLMNFKISKIDLMVSVFLENLSSSKHIDNKDGEHKNNSTG